MALVQDHPNLNTSFTLTGGGSTSDSLWNPNDTSILDGVNDYWSLGSQLMPTGLIFSVGFWFKTTDVANKLFIERNTSAQQVVELYLIVVITVEAQGYQLRAGMPMMSGAI